MTAICQKCGKILTNPTTSQEACWGPRQIESVVAWGYTCNPCARQEPDHWHQVLKDRQTFLKRALSAFMRHPTEQGATEYKQKLYAYTDIWESIKRL